MKVVIVGCGRLGSDLAYRLYRRGHEVSVIDSIAASFNNLPTDFEGRLHEGDALNQDVLHRAGIETADALASVMNSDALNAVMGHVARTVFNVPTVVVRNYDPQSKPVLEAFGLQIVSSTGWGAQRVEEMISHPDIRAIYSAGNGEVEIYEFVVTEAWAGKRLDDLLVMENVRAVSLTRNGKAMIPSGADVLQEEDIFLISATFDGAEEVRNRLVSKKLEV